MFGLFELAVRNFGPPENALAWCLTRSLWSGRESLGIGFLSLGLGEPPGVAALASWLSIARLPPRGWSALPLLSHCDSQTSRPEVPLWGEMVGPQHGAST